MTGHRTDRGGAAIDGGGHGGGGHRGAAPGDPDDRTPTDDADNAPGKHDHAHGDHGGHGGHGGHEGHAGHDPGMFRRRFWVSLALTVPLVVTSEMVMNWFGYSLDFRGRDALVVLLGSIVFWWGGWPFLAGGFAEARDRRPGMMLLITLAIVVAYVASMASSLDWFDLDFWWELAALVTIMLLGHWQEMKAIGQAQGALAALAELLPDDAERIGPGGRPAPVKVVDLRPGDVVLVRSGGRVPADGEVAEGAAELDESMITGESRPVPRNPGDRVVAGTVSTDSAIRVRVTAVGDDTALAGIQRLVAEAQSSRSRAQALADRFAALLFYVAAAAGVLTFLAWWGLGEVGDAVVRTVTVLVIACPHALGLAIPLVIALSTAVSARAGILVKDRLALERMRTIDAVLFDKTGTLTRGRHAVTGVAAAATTRTRTAGAPGDRAVTGSTTRDPGATATGSTTGGGATTGSTTGGGATTGGVTEGEVLRLAGGVESDSEHPLARAIVAAARARGPLPAATGFRSLTGRGVEAAVDGTAYAVGGPALLRDRGLALPAELRAAVEDWQARGATVLHLVRYGPDAGARRGREDERGHDPREGDRRGHDPREDGWGNSDQDHSDEHSSVRDSGHHGDGRGGGGRVIGALALEDEVRPEARRAVAALHDAGIRVAMITGDARQVADAVAADLGIDEVFAEVLPEDKDRVVTRLQGRGLTVAMVGDGVNDAPALARANVGIAIGAGTDVAIESAGVVLASSDPRGVTSVIRLSRAGYRKMRQNLAWAAGYNLLAIPLAAGALAWAGISLSPAVGAVLMSASTVVVALNAQLLRRVDLTPPPVAGEPEEPGRAPHPAPA